VRGKTGVKVGRLEEAQPQSKQPDNQASLQQVVDNFVACDRCSFFWAAYRILHGQPALEAAVAAIDGSWLELVWDGPTRHLLHKSYGGDLDVELFYYASHCPACQRRYIYGTGTEEDEAPTTFRIEVQPRVP
jgi:hypothetical protein